MSQRNTFRLQPGVVELADQAIRRVETGDRNVIAVPAAGRSGVSIGPRQMDLGQNPDLRDALIRHGRARGVIASDEQAEEIRALFAERYGTRVKPGDKDFDPGAVERSERAKVWAGNIMRTPGADAILRKGEIDHLRANARAVERLCNNAPERACDFCNSRQGQIEMLAFRHQSGEQADRAIRDLFTGREVTIDILGRRSTVQLEGNMDVEQFRSKIWDNTPTASRPGERKGIDTRRRGMDEFYRQQGIDDGSRSRINPGRRSEAPQAEPEPAAQRADSRAPTATEEAREQTTNMASSLAQPTSHRSVWTPDLGKLDEAVASLEADDLPAWTKKLLGRDVLVNGADAAVKGFQRAINASTKPPAFDYRWGLGGRQGRIEVDGDLGPQTRAGLGRAIEKQGQDGFSKLYALDQFGRYVKNVDRGRAKLDDLEDAIGGTLGQAIQDASERAQEALNMFAEDREETGAPLKIDGWIGPKTTEAFGTLLRKTSPERVMARFAGKDFWNDDDLA